MGTLSKAAGRLEPCPFCDSEAVILIVEPHTHSIVGLPPYPGGAFVECTGCTAAMSAENEQDAIERWNRRARARAPKRRAGGLCLCAHAIPQGGGIFYCDRYRLYGTARLMVCVIAALDRQWEERMRRIPPDVRRREIYPYK